MRGRYSGRRHFNNLSDDNLRASAIYLFQDVNINNTLPAINRVYNFVNLLTPKIRLANNSTEVNLLMHCFIFYFSALLLRETMADTLAELSCWKTRALAAEIESKHLRRRHKDQGITERQAKKNISSTNKIQSDLVLSRKKLLRDKNLNDTQQCVSVPEFEMPSPHRKTKVRQKGKIRNGSTKRRKDKRKLEKKSTTKAGYLSPSDDDEFSATRGKSNERLANCKPSVTKTVELKLPPIFNKSQKK